jgi:hypothetical protein
MLEHMNAAVLVCGAVVDGVSGELAGRTEIAVHDTSSSTSAAR